MFSSETKLNESAKRLKGQTLPNESAIRPNIAGFTNFFTIHTFISLSKPVEDRPLFLPSQTSSKSGNKISTEIYQNLVFIPKSVQKVVPKSLPKSTMGMIIFYLQGYGGC